LLQRLTNNCRKWRLHSQNSLRIRARKNCTSFLEYQWCKMRNIHVYPYESVNQPTLKWSTKTVI
jgi:hypothetical protein